MHQTWQLPGGGRDPAARLQAMFDVYGDAGGHWTGGGGTTSVALPDGRVVWLFTAAYLGPVAADRRRPLSAPMVANCAVVQDGDALTATLHGGTPAAPRALVEAASGDEHLRPAGGAVEGGRLKVLYHRIRDGHPVGTVLATFELPSLTPSPVVELPVGTAVHWGSALLAGDGHTYVYGTEPAPGRMRFAHVARATAGDLGGAWEFWTGSAWSADPDDSRAVLSGVGTAYGVTTAVHPARLHRGRDRGAGRRPGRAPRRRPRRAEPHHHARPGGR